MSSRTTPMSATSLTPLPVVTPATRPAAEATNMTRALASIILLITAIALTAAPQEPAPAQQTSVVPQTDNAPSSVHASSEPGVPHPSPSGEGAINANFRVKYVATDAVYLEAGRSAGLAEGTALVIKGALPPDARQQSTDGA